MAEGFKGKSVCITGTLALMTREDAIGAIEKSGGSFDKAVKYYTDFLVVADKPGAVKVKQAKSYGIRTLTERQFLDKLKGNPTADIFLPDNKKVDHAPVPQAPLGLETREW